MFFFLSLSIVIDSFMSTVIVGSAIKCTACSSKGPEFNSQQLQEETWSVVLIKPNIEKFNRTAIYRLPMHSSALPRHNFHFNLISLWVGISGLSELVGHSFRPFYLSKSLLTSQMLI